MKLLSNIVLYLNKVRIFKLKRDYMHWYRSVPKLYKSCTTEPAFALCAIQYVEYVTSYTTQFVKL